MSSREEQSPSVIRVKSTHFPYDPHHLRKSSKGSLVLYQFSLQTNLVCVWNCLGLLLLHYFLSTSLLQTSSLFYLTKEVHDLTWENSPYYSSLDFGQSEAWDEPSRLEFPVANQLGFRAETLRINIKELIWNPQTSRGRSKYFSFILTPNLKKLTYQTFSVVVEFLGIESRIPCMLNKHSTPASLPQSVHQLGGGKRWGGAGMRWRVGIEAELVSHIESHIGSGWPGTWDGVPLPPVLRLQACTPTLRSQASSL